MKKFLPLFFIVISLALFACTIGQQSPQERADIATQAAQTVEAILSETTQNDESLTEAPPAPSAPPAQATATLAPEVDATSEHCADSANINTWLRDNAPYDTKMADTAIAPAKGFLMSWNIINQGDCVWDDTYRFVFASGERLTTQDSIPVMPNNYQVKPGESLTISVQMSAPQKNGTYQSNYDFVNNEGEAVLSFGVVTLVGSSSAPQNASLAAPGNLRYEYDCSGGTTRISLYWSDKATNEQGYRIYRDGAQIADLPAGATSYSDIAPMPGAYLYAVAADNASGESATSMRVETSACQ